MKCKAISSISVQVIRKVLIQCTFQCLPVTFRRQSGMKENYAPVVFWHEIYTLSAAGNSGSLLV